MAVAARADGIGVRNIGNTTASSRNVIPGAQTPNMPVYNIPTAPTTDPYAGSYNAGATPAPTQYTDAQLQADALKTPEYVMAQQQLANALGLFKSQQASDRQRYDVNYEQALRNLGWIPEATDINGMASKGKWDMGELMSQQGKQTTAGKAFTGNLNDFAARGLSQSGMFAVAQNAIQNQLNEQLRSAETGRSSYQEDLQNKQNQFFQEQENQRQQALMAAKENLLNQLMGQSGLGG